MWEHCQWWLNQITDSFSLSSPLWTCTLAGESTSRNVSFLIPHSPRTLSVLTLHIHVTTCVFTNSSSPQDFSFDYPPVVEHTASSSIFPYLQANGITFSANQVRSLPCHPTNKAKTTYHNLTTCLQRPLFQSDSICYILTLPEAQTFNFWKGPLRQRRAGE